MYNYSHTLDTKHTKTYTAKGENLNLHIIHQKTKHFTQKHF